MIRRFLLTTTALVAVSGVASAADLPMRAPAPYIPPPLFTWTGFYVGASVGGISLSTKAAEYDSYGKPFSSATNYGGGVIAGGGAGYNYQMGSIVLGIEADFSYTGAQTNFTDSYNYVFGKTQLTDLGTVRGRLGFTPWERTLLYVTGGYAWGNLSNALGYEYPRAGYLQKASTTGSGWTIGGGIEQAITDHITVKAEALYVDLGSKNGIDKGCCGGCRTNFKNTAVVGRVGINYKF